MKRTISDLLCRLMLTALLLCGTDFASGGPNPDTDVGMTVTVRQNDITILCPDQIAYQIQPVEQWDAGMYGLKRLPFSNASVSGRLLYCTYEVNNGVARDASTLTKAMPNGYICSVYHSGGKRRQFQCKRATPPIKIKPQSD